MRRATYEDMSNNGRLVIWTGNKCQIWRAICKKDGQQLQVRWMDGQQGLFATGGGVEPLGMRAKRLLEKTRGECR